MGNRSKDENAATSSDARHQESRDATLARIIAEAVAQQTKSIVEAVSKQKAEETQSLTDVFQRQMEETRVQYEELLKASRAQNFTSTLKVTSSTDGFRVMDPFDWTADKNIYQRWQLWSHKARLALDAMEGDNEKTKISYLHHWLDGKGIDKIKGWMNSKILITQAEYDALEERDRKGKYSSDKIESYFSLVENILTPRSNPLLAVEELHVAKQGSMTSQEFYSQILEIVKRCHFPNQAAEERAVRDAIFIGMNSQRAKDKAINLMNEEGKEVTVEFLMNHLAVEDGNSQHRFLSQFDSSTSVNMVAYDRRQNKGKSNRLRNNNGREREQNKSRGQTSSSTTQTSRKPPGMEGKCIRCGRPEHQQGENCAARNAKCKDCHKIGHFYKVCQSSKRTRRANLAQVTPQDEDDTYIDECGYTQSQPGYTQPNPPVVNMLKVTNHTGTTSGTQFLKFPVDVNPRVTYKHHLEVSIDTGADVNCMNEKTFKKLFPEVELSVCPHSIQNFGNSTADVYILGQFRTFLQFRGRKYLNTFIVTNANDCPNILSHGAIFRMGILVANYPKENMVKSGDMETGTSNVFRVLQDLLKSCSQSTKHAPKKQEVNTCTNCEHSYRHMNDHLTQNTGRMQRQHLQNFSHAEFLPGMENTPAFLGKQFLQGKEEITCPYMENIPALLWNQSIQGNEKNVDTCTFIPGSTTPNRHSMLSIPTHSRKIPQNFQQMEKESSNTVALPGFNHNADTTTHVETSRNVYGNGALSTSLKTDTNMNANMDTNHTAHRYRHTRKEDHLLSGPSELQPLEAMVHQYTKKEDHLLSGPSELRPLKAMAHRDTRKEAHLLSGPSELQPTEDSETQKFDSAHVQLPRQEYS